MGKSDLRSKTEQERYIVLLEALQNALTIIYEVNTDIPNREQDIDDIEDIINDGWTLVD